MDDSGWVKYWADERGKVAELEYKSFITSMERADKKTGWVGKACRSFADKRDKVGIDGVPNSCSSTVDKLGKMTHHFDAIFHLLHRGKLH